MASGCDHSRSRGPAVRDEIARLARPAVLAIKPYSSARRESPQEDVTTFLDANENPFPPYPGDDTCLDMNRYPMPQPPELVALFSAHYGVATEQLLVTRGADEAIDLLARVFCHEGRDAVIITPPTFPMYGMAAQVQGAWTIEVPLLHEREGIHRDCGLDANAIRVACERPGAPKLVFICSPNNPTGGLLDGDVVLSLCDGLLGRALVVVDEAYLDFCGQPSMSTRLPEHPNLVVLRTLSKGYSLAGERCGITLAHPDVIELMSRILAPYPIPRSVITTVLRAMTSGGVTSARHHIFEMVAERAALAAHLELLEGPVRGIFRSDANFVLVELADPRLLLTMMAARNIKIRDRSPAGGIEGCVRISVGTPDQNVVVRDVFSAYADRAIRAASTC